MKNLILDALYRSSPLTASVRPSSDDLLAWVGIYRVDLARNRGNDRSSEILRERAGNYIRNHNLQVPPGADSIFRIRFFEMEKEKAAQDIHFCEDDLLNKKDFHVYSEDEILQVLSDLNLKVSDLGGAWKTNYPI